MTCKRVVVVKFSSDPFSKEYNYFTIDPTVKIGDYVLVDSPFSGLTSLKVLRVIDASRFAGLKYIVGKTSQNDTKKQDALRGLRTIRAQISSRRAVIWKRAKVKFIDELAQEDAEYLGLVKELKRLSRIAGEPFDIDTDIPA